MIESLKGILHKKDPTTAIIDVGGVRLSVNITLSTYEKLEEINSSIELLTYFNVREDAMELYGFIDDNERYLFKQLTSINGIGPKSALNILSGTSPNSFKKNIINGDIGSLTSIPGIGAKTAKRIIIELKDKFTLTNKNDMPIENTPSVNSDAYFALISLGYKSNEVKNILNQLSAEDKKLNTEQKIKFALKKLR